MFAKQNPFVCIYIYWYFWWLITRSWSNLFLSYLLFNSSIFICLSNLTYFQPLWFVFFFLKWNNKSQPCIFCFHAKWTRKTNYKSSTDYYRLFSFEQNLTWRYFSCSAYTMLKINVLWRHWVSMYVRVMSLSLARNTVVFGGVPLPNFQEQENNHR